MRNAEGQNWNNVYIVDKNKSRVSFHSIKHKRVVIIAIVLSTIIESTVYGIVIWFDPTKHQNTEYLACELNGEHYQNLSDVCNWEKCISRLLNAKFISCGSIPYENDRQKV